jgi:hypothetical protein
MLYIIVQVDAAVTAAARAIASRQARVGTETDVQQIKMADGIYIEDTVMRRVCN